MKKDNGNDDVDDVEREIIDIVSENQREIINLSIREVMEQKKDGGHTLNELMNVLNAHNIDMSQDLVSKYLDWISEHLTEYPDLYLPQILYDEENLIFYDVS